MTSRFLDPLRVEQIGWRDGRPLWKTLTPLRYASARLGAVVVIPAEFITDLASTPRWLLAWWIAGGRAPRPAVLHDYPYQAGEYMLVDGTTLAVTRAETDAVLDEAMAADPMSGTGTATRWLMWAAVRLGGRGVWSDKARSAEINPIWTAEGWPDGAVEGP